MDGGKEPESHVRPSSRRAAHRGDPRFVHCLVRSGARREHRRALVREGLAHFERSEYAAARAAFAAAYARAPTTATLLNLALAELNAGSFVDALHHFRQYVGDPHAKRDKVARIRDELIPRAHRVTGHLRVDAPPFAVVAVDGTTCPDAGGIVDVTPGRHLVNMAVGSTVTRVEVDAPAGETVVVHIVPVVPPERADAPRAASPPPVATPKPAPSARDVGPAPSSASFWTTRTTLGLSLGLGALGASVAGGAFLVASNDAAGNAAALRGAAGATACTTSASATLRSAFPRRGRWSVHGARARDGLLRGRRRPRRRVRRGLPVLARA